MGKRRGSTIVDVFFGTRLVRSLTSVRLARWGHEPEFSTVGVQLRRCQCLNRFLGGFVTGEIGVVGVVGRSRDIKGTETGRRSAVEAGTAGRVGSGTTVYFVHSNTMATNTRVKFKVLHLWRSTVGIGLQREDCW